MDDDPYAPPVTTEPQAHSMRMWRVEGDALLARNGAVLAQVDLDSGEREEDMKSNVRVHHFVSLTNFALICAAGLLVPLIHVTGVERYLLLGVMFVAVIFWQRGRAAAGKVSNRVAVREFVDMATMEGRVKRRKMRIGLCLVIVLLVAAVPILWPPASLKEFLVQAMVAFTPGFTALAGVAIWAVLDGPKAKYRTAGPGWVRIAPVHPRALEFLRDLEAREMASEGPRRLVFTHFLHRYPLRTLLRLARTPAEILRMVQVKLQRLEAEAYHDTLPDAELSALCDPVQQAVGNWCASHPDWQVISCHVIDHPTGSYEHHMARLACADLNHHLWVIKLSLAAKAPAGKTHFTFATWLADHTLVETHDYAAVSLADPMNPSFRARGKPEAIFRAHLSHCAHQPIDPPETTATLVERMAVRRDAIRLHLVGLGYQSAPH